MDVPNWKDLHPFPIGQTVYVKPGVVVKTVYVLGPGSSLIVHMLGHDAEGPWFGSEAFRGARFNVSDFTLTPPLQPEPHAAAPAQKAA